MALETDLPLLPGLALPFPCVSVLIHPGLISRLVTWDRATSKAPAAWGLRAVGWEGLLGPAHREDAEPFPPQDAG